MTRTSARPEARWVYNPHAGGLPIPDSVRRQLGARLRAHMADRYAGHGHRLEVRFKGKFGYLDLHRPEPLGDDFGYEPDVGVQLCRLHFHGALDRWSFALFSYASERYEASSFASGDMIGPAEDALDCSAMFYLH